VAFLSSALGVPVAEALPTIPDLDDLAITHHQTEKLFDQRLEGEN